MRSSIVGALSVVALAASGTVGGASLARAPTTRSRCVGSLPKRSRRS